MLQNIFAYSFVSEHPKHYLLWEKKTASFFTYSLTNMTSMIKDINIDHGSNVKEK